MKTYIKERNYYPGNDGWGIPKKKNNRPIEMITEKQIRLLCKLTGQTANKFFKLNVVQASKKIERLLSKEIKVKEEDCIIPPF